MKIRTDFVTNSSSSSFILARKGELSEEQKEAIIDFVEKTFFGEKVLTPASTEEEIQRAVEDDLGEDYEDTVRKAVKDGKDIYYGYVSFEEADYTISHFYQELWNVITSVEKKNFTVIDGDLSY